MKLLLSYLKNYKKIVLLALLLAAVNQCFSLMDPVIAGKMLDRFGVHIADYQGDPTKNFYKDIMMLLLAAVGVAMVSRIAKNFQDYFVNVVVQRVGADMYNDGIRHSLELPYQVFEAADGQVVLAIGNDHQFAKFCEASGCVLHQDARFRKNADRVRHREVIVPLLAK